MMERRGVRPEAILLVAQGLWKEEAKSEARMLKIGYRSSSVTGLDVISETM
jgi:hypothetical protein